MYRHGAKVLGPPAIDQEFGTIDFLTYVEIGPRHERLFGTMRRLRLGRFTRPRRPGPLVVLVLLSHHVRSSRIEGRPWSLKTVSQWPSGPPASPRR